MNKCAKKLEMPYSTVQYTHDKALRKLKKQLFEQYGITSLNDVI